MNPASNRFCQEQSPLQLQSESRGEAGISVDFSERTVRRHMSGPAEQRGGVEMEDSRISRRNFLYGSCRDRHKERET